MAKSPLDSRQSDIARLRMFAGPNGSGKTSLVRKLSTDFSTDGLFPLYSFLNADEILQRLRIGEGVSLEHLERVPTQQEVRGALVAGQRLGANHPFLHSLTVQNGRIIAAPENADGYVGAAIADFLRDRMLAQHTSFSLETVMSHVSKVEKFESARSLGYRTYLYFIATDSPDLNLLRVEARVALGEHDVPRDKVVNRYQRSLKLAVRAIRAAYRAYVFDNSRKEPTWLAEWKPDRTAQLQVPSEELPNWFKTWIVPAYPELLLEAGS